MAKLYLIAGHGAGDPGATGGGYEEAERVRALAAKIEQYGGSDVAHYPYGQNCYADNGLARVNPGCPVLELHMDSAGEGARGGHVIIAEGAGGADAYDNALAELMGRMLPGRSRLVVERSDLQNPNVARMRGINYRLVEFGFISDAADREVFNTRIDELAKGVLACFGVGAASQDQDVIVWPTNGNANQRWVLAKQADGSYTVACKANGKLLDVANASKASGANVIAYKANGGANQRWLLEPVKSGYSTLYRITPAIARENALDVYGASDKDGASVIAYKYHGGANQHWAVMDNGDGTVTIVSNGGRKLALDAKGGA